ncbi:MAG: ATP-dependent zinc metalloprotease FtsH [Clostridia bacterium]|nr:ATP-dependent zinc metalloprotease FtsH [Clostridia bacterium]
MKILKAVSPYILIFSLVVLAVVLITNFVGNKKLEYSQFIVELNEKNVESVEYEDNKAKVVIKADSAKDESVKAGKYDVKILDQGEFEGLMIDQILAGNPVKYHSEIRSVPFIVRILPYLMLGILAIFLFFMIFRQSQAGAGSNGRLTFGRSNARLYTKSKIKFADLAGADEEKEEMEELVSFLKDPAKYDSLGARIPKGVLLVGPPGTGKTYLAKAVAGEAGVPFFNISGSDFVELYVGVGAARVRDLFEQAKKNAPAIVFIDEIDAVGRHRGAGLGGGHDEREQTLNQLLVEMDGFESNTGVIVMAATNRPDILDPALTRPGRFDRKINVSYPDMKAREAILRVHTRNKPLDETVDLAEVAKNTSGFTPADLENLLNESALLAARDNHDKISSANIKEAIFRVIVGKEKRSRVMTDKDKWLTAIHEVGHAIAIKYLSTTEKVERVSIIPAGSAGGYTAHRPDEDRTYVTKAQLLEAIDISLGGRVAEKLVLNDISTGASSDLEQVSAIARSMVTKYGMSDEIGNVIFNTGAGDEIFIGRDYGHSKNYSEETAALIDEAVKKIIDAEEEKVTKLISDNIDKLKEIAGILIERERLEGDEFEELFTDNN